MRRDMDLVRQVLLKVEAITEAPLASYIVYASGSELEIDGFTPNQVLYHMDWVMQAGLVDGVIGADGHIVLKKLSWQGCEFLDDVRSPEIWRKTKERAGSVASVGLGFIWEIAKAELKIKLGLP